MYQFQFFKFQKVFIAISFHFISFHFLYFFLFCQLFSNLADQLQNFKCYPIWQKFAQNLRPILFLEMSSQKNERFLGHISSSDSVLSFRMKAGKGSGEKVPLSHSMAFFYFRTTFWLLLTLFCWALNIPHSFLRIKLLIQKRNGNYLLYFVLKLLVCYTNLNEILMSLICKSKVIPKGALYSPT